MESLFDSAWRIADCGYQWMDVWNVPTAEGGPKEPARILTSGVPLGRTYSGWVYRPMAAHPALFIEFAELQATEEAIQSFANEYGLLRNRETMVMPTSPKQGLLVSGDIHGVWRTQITRMREAMEVWTLSRASRTRELSERIEWRDSSVWYRFGRRSVKLADENTHATRRFLEVWRKGEVVRPAQRFLQLEVNEQLQEEVSGRLLWDKKDRGMSLHVVPNTLLGVLWLQFARAVSGVKDYRRCGNCGKMIELSTDQTGRRSDAQFCSPACRMQNYRNRQGEARRLARRGKSVTQIATQLGAKPATIRGWIKAK